MKKVFVTLNQDQSVSVSMEVQYDEDGNIVIYDGYDGPYDVLESFEMEQHLYRLDGGALVKDMDKAEQVRIETLGIEERTKRDELLKSTDHLMIPDYPIGEDEREAWRIYRQALRELPQQPGWPDNVNWPVSSVAGRFSNELR